VLANCREQLLDCYDTENGRPGVEPVVLLGILIFQFLERVPDRQAMGVSKISSWLETGAELEIKPKAFPSDDIGLLPPLVMA
jgi:hypothetical protein